MQVIYPLCEGLSKHRMSFDFLRLIVLNFIRIKFNKSRQIDKLASLLWLLPAISNQKDRAMIEL